MNLQEYLHSIREKTVAVIGIGVSNTPLIELLLDSGIAVTACDKKERGEFDGLCEALEAKGYNMASAEVEYIPSTMTHIDDPDLVIKMGKMLEIMEENDDIQDIWHNWENEEDYE